MDSTLALHPVALGSILGIPRNFLLILLRFNEGTSLLCQWTAEQLNS